PLHGDRRSAPGRGPFARDAAHGVSVARASYGAGEVSRLAVAHRSERRHRCRPPRFAADTEQGDPRPQRQAGPRPRPFARHARTRRNRGDAAAGPRHLAVAAGGIPRALEPALPGRRRLRNDSDANGIIERLAARVIAPWTEALARGDAKGI